MLAFVGLFKDACARCFGHPLDKPLSEPESRHLSNEIEEKTGLVVGWKSIKNYAVFVLSASPEKQENPSMATLDTLARYVYDAPPTSEIQRKRNEAHFAFWFRYLQQFPVDRIEPTPGLRRSQKKIRIVAVLALLALVMLVALYFLYPKQYSMVEEFQATDEEYLEDKGWVVLSKEPAYWERRAENPGQLTLFTLEGDNWTGKEQSPVIRNLLVQKIEGNCFSAEVHLSDFVPGENWQQAGLLLVEDTAFNGKCLRLSLSYNDFFGGYSKPGEIIIQAIASYGKQYQNVEEIAHHPLFTLDGKTGSGIISYNLKHSAVRLEKQDKTFRFLYSASPFENFSFKELVTYEFDMKPAFVGVFALKGFVDTASVVPVGVRFFRLDSRGCD